VVNSVVPFSRLQVVMALRSAASFVGGSALVGSILALATGFTLVAMISTSIGTSVVTSAVSSVSLESIVTSDFLLWAFTSSVGLEAVSNLIRAEAGKLLGLPTGFLRQRISLLV